MTKKHAEKTRTKTEIVRDHEIRTASLQGTTPMCPLFRGSNGITFTVCRCASTSSVPLKRESMAGFGSVPVEGTSVSTATPSPQGSSSRNSRRSRKRCNPRTQSPSTNWWRMRCVCIVQYSLGPGQSVLIRRVASFLRTVAKHATLIQGWPPPIFTTWHVKSSYIPLSILESGSLVLWETPDQGDSGVISGVEEAKAEGEECESREGHGQEEGGFQTGEDPGD